MSRRKAETALRPPEPRARWVWFVPFGVIVVAFLSFLPPIGGLERLVGMSLGLLIIAWASRHPDFAIIGLIVGLPFQNLVLAQLFAWGLSAQVVRPLASWKEALALGVVVAGARQFVSERRRADALDLLALGFVAIVALYALMPGIFAPGAPSESGARSLAFRGIAGFVLLLLGARHARLPRDLMERAARVILAVGVVIAVIAVYEFTLSSSWNDFVVNRVQYPLYQLQVLEILPFNFQDIRFYGHLGGREFVRVGSVLLSPLGLGFYLLLPFAVAIERTVRHGLRSYSGAALGIIGAALLFTQTRAALIGAVVVAFIALRPAAGRDWSRRIQFTFVLILGLLIVVPAAFATGLSERVTTAASGDEETAVDHIEALRNGIEVVAANPMGLGVGTSAGTGQRFQTETLVITENYYLQVGVEVGIVGMVAFVALTLVLLRRLRLAQLAVPDLTVSAARSAMFGLAVGAFFLHTWAIIPVAWPAWAVAGAAIGRAEQDQRDALDAANRVSSGE